MNPAEVIKDCPRCLEAKPVSAFYRNRSRADGRQTYCAACQRSWHSKDRDREAKRAYERRQRNNPEYLAKRREKQRLWSARNPEKVRAHKVVQAATRRGALVRPGNCGRCGVECRPEASHSDYSRPLDVEWLCRLCHADKDNGFRGTRPALLSKIDEALS